MKQGDEIPELKVTPDKYLPHRYAGASGDYNPIHVDPEVGLNFAMMVHGGQEFVWGEPVCSGDVITTINEFKDYSEKDDKKFFVFESVSTNQDGHEVCRGTWTNIVRGG